MLKFKHKIVLIIVVTFISFLPAQDRIEAMYSGYKQHNYTVIKNELINIKPENQTSLEYQFFSALFHKNGEEAKETFQVTFEKGDQRLKKLSAKKLMDYYYAKGYYVNASKYQEYLIDEGNWGNISAEPINHQEPQQPVNKPVIPKTDSDPEKYFIQVGAFSLKENAGQLIKMLATQNIKARIVERKIEQKKLFCVWLEGKEDFKKTYDYANVIKEKYDLKFRIIK